MPQMSRQPITIPYENGDFLLHEPPYYFCQFPTCPCHNDETLVGVLISMLDAHEITGYEALRIYWNQQEASS